MDTKEPVENIAQPPTFNKIVNPSCGQGSSVRNNTFEVLIEPEDIIHRLTIALKDAGCELRVMEQAKKVSWCGVVCMRLNLLQHYTLYNIKGLLVLSQIKACIMTPSRGMIGIVFQVFSTPTGHPTIVEARRAKGDNLVIEIPLAY